MPEEQSELEMAQNGWKYKVTLQEIFSAIRSNRKYGDDKDMPKTWEDLNDWFFKIVEKEDCPNLFD